MSTTDNALARIEASMAGNQEVLVNGMDGLRSLMAVMNQHLAMIAESLNREAGDAPTLDELLAEIVKRMGDVRTTANRTLTIVDGLANDLPDRVIRLMNDLADQGVTPLRPRAAGDTQ